MFLLSASLLLYLASPALTGPNERNVVRGVIAEGACAVVGMSAEQCQLIALQRARASAIEQAGGVSVSSSTLVTNFKLSVDFVKTYSKGYIVKESIEWLPLGQYQKDASTPPIPEYSVKITADVYMPERKIKPLGLFADSNGKVYRSGEKASITVKTERKAKIAIFNITAEDNVVMLFPNEHDRANIVTKGGELKYPSKECVTELEMATLPGHKRDAEAFFVVAMDAEHERDFMDIFKPLSPMGLSEFFSKYSEIADYSEDRIIAYEVSGE